MAKEILWRNTLSVQLGGVVLLLLLGALVFVALNLWTASAMTGDAAAVNHASKGRFRGYEMLLLADHLLDGTADRKETLKELRQAMDLAEKRFDQLLTGDTELGIPAATDAEI